MSSLDFTKWMDPTRRWNLLFPRCETGPHKTIVDGKVVKRSAQSDFFGVRQRQYIREMLRRPEAKGVFGVMQGLAALSKRK